MIEAPLETKSSSAIVPINGIMALLTNEVKFTDKSGNVFLKSGSVETDLASYPDATNAAQAITGVGQSYDASAHVTGANAIKYVDGFYWLKVGNVIHQYTLDFTPTGQVVDFSGVLTQSVQDFDWDGSYWWVIDGTTKYVKQIEPDGSALTGNSFNTQTTQSAYYCLNLVFCGDRFWCMAGWNDQYYEFTKSGNSYAKSGRTISIPSHDISPLTWDGNHLWLIGSTTKTIYKYTMNGVNTGISYYFGGGNTINNLTWNGDVFLYAFSNSVFVELLTDKVIGMANQKLDSKTGLPLYMRIK